MSQQVVWVKNGFFTGSAGRIVFQDERRALVILPSWPEFPTMYFGFDELSDKPVYSKKEKQ